MSAIVRALRAQAEALAAQANALSALADAIERGPDVARPPSLVGPGDVGLTSREWRSAIASGQLRAARVGKRLLATREDFAAYLASRRVEPGVRTGAPVELSDVDELIVEAQRNGQLRAIGGGGAR